MWSRKMDLYKLYIPGHIVKGLACMGCARNDNPRAWLGYVSKVVAQAMRPTPWSSSGVILHGERETVSQYVATSSLVCKQAQGLVNVTIL